MALEKLRLSICTWWYLRIARNATIPPDVARHLMTLKESNQLALEQIERNRQVIIDSGAAAGKTISTEATLRRVLEIKKTYEGPNREEYVREIDQFIDDFRKKHGPQIPVDQAYDILKELETRFGPPSR
jgi:hypothetical protein